MGVKFIQVSAPTALIRLHSKDSHAVVVTKYLAKITHLLLQCIMTKLSGILHFMSGVNPKLYEMLIHVDIN